VDSINYNLKYLEGEVAKMGLTMVMRPSGVFTPDELADPRAQEFGCEPDYNAWTRSINPRPHAADQNLRSAGGHIHIGYRDLDPEQVVRAMDVFVGAQMLEFDDDTRRRSLYGKAGAFRFKPYGVEYRTASNAWITSDERKEWVYNQTRKALEFVSRGVHIPADGIGTTIQTCINESKKELLPEIYAFAEQ
jgi:hypothetical protein